MVKASLISALCLASTVSSANGYAFVPGRSAALSSSSRSTAVAKSRPTSTTLSMVDQNVIMGAGIAVAGLAAGIGLVAFAENMGERSEARGGGISDSMSTQLAGSLMEDVEVSSVQDLGSLTSQLEAALKETGGAKEDDLEMTEEDKRKIAEEADDGW